MPHEDKKKSSAMMSDKQRAKMKVRAIVTVQEKQKSMRTRRRAREIFTNLKATGKIPKDLVFSDLSEEKFFRAAKDIKDSEIKRAILNRARMNRKPRRPGPLERK